MGDLLQSVCVLVNYYFLYIILDVITIFPA